MSKLTDRASYLKGLADGMDLNMEKGSNKLLVEALSVMQEMAEELEKLSNAHDELNEYVESIDDDLADLEDVLFGDEEDEDDDCDDEVIITMMMKRKTTRTKRRRTRRS